MEANTVQIIWTVLQGISTVAIALCGLYLAFRNTALTSHKIRFDLYGKRLAVYQSIKDFVRRVRRSDFPTQEEWLEYRDKWQEVAFLFESKVVRWVQNVKDEAEMLDSSMQILQGGEHVDIEMMGSSAKDKQDAERALFRLDQEAETVFMPYLDFRSLRLNIDRK